MKKSSALAFSLLLGWGVVTAACDPQVTPPITGTGGTATGGVPATGGIVGTGGIVATGGVSETGGSGGAPVGTGGDMALGGTCNVASMEVLERSDTDGNWDDQDFSEGVTLSGSCPVVVDVTWPHEAGWEAADVVDANFEKVHFNLDVYPGVDFTGKQINLTIKLAAEELGVMEPPVPGGYIVSLMSVSTFEVPVEGSGGAGSGGAGSGGTAGSGGDTGSGGAATMTSYTETKSPDEDLLLVGDVLTMSYPLPAKGPNENSYDPATAIKMSIRIGPAWTDIGAPPPEAFAFLTARFEITEFSLTDVTP